MADLAACFAEDGVLEFPGAHAQGREAIRTVLTSGETVAGRTFVRHHITNPLIDLAGDGAVARSYFTVHSDNGPDHSGTYDDKFVRTAEGFETSRFTWDLGDRDRQKGMSEWERLTAM